jgi:hypothetical protein
MAEHSEPIELDDASDLLRMAEEVRRSHTPRLLHHAGEDLALLVPVTHPSKTPRRGREKTAADYEAFRRAAGSWKGLIDTDELIENIYENRRISTRPLVQL